jgi:hypothetical protein
MSKKEEKNKTTHIEKFKTKIVNEESIYNFRAKEFLLRQEEVRQW